MFSRRAYNHKLTSRARDLRLAMTPAEKKLWFQFLIGSQPRWLRQRVIAQFIVDFYCSACALVVELDGSQHFTEDGLARDVERTAILEAQGLMVLRFTNQAVMREFDGVCLQIQEIQSLRLMTTKTTQRSDE